jgi:hypothetical protein
MSRKPSGVLALEIGGKSPGANLGNADESLYLDVLFLNRVRSRVSVLIRLEPCFGSFADGGNRRVLDSAVYGDRIQPLLNAAHDSNEADLILHFQFA